MWDLLQNEDETMIADSVREYLAGELPIERLRPNAPPTDYAKARQGMAELGWFGVGLPESVGGSGLGLVEEMLIQRECGRFMVSPSVLAAGLAGHVAFHAADTDLASDLAAGNVPVALATEAVPDAEGTQRIVQAFDWSGSGLLLFWNDAGMGLFDAAGLAEIRTEDCLDDSVTMHVGVLEAHRARLWVPADAQPLVLRAQVLLSAAMVGLAEHACELSVAYARLREQFGKPIGSFQAVKHRCADMAVRMRLAWYLTSLAGLKLQSGADDASLQIASAKMLAAEAAHENGRAGIQIHGGIGFQSECDAHWFVKRACVYDQAGGAMAQQASRVIAAPVPAW